MKNISCGTGFNRGRAPVQAEPVKYLVMGGAGSIASHLVRLLLESRPVASVLSLDSLTYAGSLDRLAGLDAHERYRFIESDICDADIVRDATEGVRPGTLYNLGGDNERTNLSIVESVVGTLRKPLALIEHVADRKGHDRRYAINASRALDELGWRPKVDFTVGLAETIQWHLDHQAWWTQL